MLESLHHKLWLEEIENITELTEKAKNTLLSDDLFIFGNMLGDYEANSLKEYGEYFKDEEKCRDCRKYPCTCDDYRDEE